MNETNRLEPENRASPHTTVADVRVVRLPIPFWVAAVVALMLGAGTLPWVVGDLASFFYQARVLAVVLTSRLLLGRVGASVLAAGGLTYASLIAWTLSFALRKATRLSGRNPLRVLGDESSG